MDIDQPGSCSEIPIGIGSMQLEQHSEHSRSLFTTAQLPGLTAPDAEAMLSTSAEIHAPMPTTLGLHSTSIPVSHAHNLLTGDVNYFSPSHITSSEGLPLQSLFYRKVGIRTLDVDIESPECASELYHMSMEECITIDPSETCELSPGHPSAAIQLRYRVRDGTPIQEPETMELIPTQDLDTSV